MHFIHSRKPCAIAEQCFTIKMCMDEARGPELKNMVVGDSLGQLEMTDNLNKGSWRLALVQIF